MPEIKPTEVESSASIKVVGVGGAGGSAVDRMKEIGLSGVEFVAVNTDAQALHHSSADVKVHIGKGLGAGGDPEKGREAAESGREAIGKSLEGADMVFITLGAGGGTGSGAGPIVAEESKGRDILTVGVATKPFTFEGAKRRENAEKAIDALSQRVDALITIPNDRLLQTIDPRTPLTETFKIADDVLRQGVQGISELITEHSLINLDFADVKAIMKNAGSALMGIGRASGDNRATLAAQQAIESPLIEVKIDGARGVLFSVAGGYDMAMSEIQEAAEIITGAVSPDANIIFGASIRPELEDEMVVTVVATGFDSEYYRKLDMERASMEPVSNMSTATVGSLASSMSSMDAEDRGVEYRPVNRFGGSSYGSTSSASDMGGGRIETTRDEHAQATTSNDSRFGSSDSRFGGESRSGNDSRFGGDSAKDTGATDFTAENRSNMWDSIPNNDQEDDLDVPPTLRDRLRGKNRGVEMTVLPKIGDSKVLESREADDGTTIRRRRVSPDGHRFTTYERIELPQLIVVKRSGNREIFDRDKLITSVKRSVGKFLDSELEIEGVVDQVVELLRAENDEQITSQQVGDAVLDVLAERNEVAYVRFASVFLDFKTLADFEGILKQRREAKK